jgi:hypothetical protein
VSNVLHGLRLNFQLGQRDLEFEKLRQNKNYMVFILEEPNTKLYLKNLFFLRIKIGTKGSLKK